MRLKINTFSFRNLRSFEVMVIKVWRWYTYQLYDTVIKLVGNCVQEFGGNCRRSALAGGKRVFEDLIQKKQVFGDLNQQLLVFLI